MPFAAASSTVADEVASGLNDSGVLKEVKTAESKATDAKVKGAMPMAKPQAKEVQRPGESGADTIEGKLGTLFRKTKEKLFFRMQPIFGHAVLFAVFLISFITEPVTSGSCSSSMCEDMYPDKHGSFYYAGNQQKRLP